MNGCICAQERGGWRDIGFFTMKLFIRVASDLHLEAFIGRDEQELVDRFLPKDKRDTQSILVLAGDISSHPDQLIHFLDACLEQFDDIIFVPGNHEYYRHHFHQWNIDMEARLEQLRQKHLSSGKGLYFTVDDVKTADISGTRFIFGTMWCDGGLTLQDQLKISFYLNDFRVIKTGDGSQRFTVQDMMTQFQIAKRRIVAELETPFNGKKVVVTHHLPSRRLVSQRFLPSNGSDGINGGFVGSCDDLLAKTEAAPALWIHGHTHDTIDTKIWNTRIVCNPAGYRSEWVSPFNSFMGVDADGQRIANPKFIPLEEL